MILEVPHSKQISNLKLLHLLQLVVFCQPASVLSSQLCYPYSIFLRMIMETFVFNIVCQMIPYITKKCIKFIAISNLSVIIEFYSLKYVGHDLLLLLLDRISFIVFQVFFMSNLN